MHDPCALRLRLRPGSRPAVRAFTLVEILIVVTILGILAAIVIPQFGTASDEARQKVFAASLKQFTRAAQVYMAEHGGQYIDDATSGEIPPQLMDFIDAGKWNGGTPIGGLWDAERDGFAGMLSGIGVHFQDVPPRPDVYMTQIDATIDDGDLATGAFRKFAADRFYYIIVAE